MLFSRERPSRNFMNFSLLPSWAASRTPISCRPASSPGRLKKGAFDETLSRGPASGPKPHRNRPVLLSHKTVYRTAIYGSQKQDGSMPSPRAPHRLRPGEHERSGPHLADRCSQETRLRQGSHLCRQSFRGPLEATRPRCLQAPESCVRRRIRFREPSSWRGNGCGKSRPYRGG